MASRDYTRREIVRRSGTGLVTAGLVAGAGCAGPTGPRTDDTSTGNIDDWTGPEYGRWLPAPQTVLPVSQYQFGMTDLTEFADHRGKLPPGVQDVVQSWEPIEIDWRTVPRSLTLHGNNVIQAEYDRDAVINQVAGTEGWTKADTYEGYALLHNSESRGIAVGDETIVNTHDSGEDKTAIEIAQGLIDTAQGKVATYPGTSAAVDAVMDEFDDGGFVNMWIPVEAFDASPQNEPEFDRQVGLGRWGQFTDEGATNVKLIVAFESADAADKDQVQSYTDDHSDDGEQFAPWQNIAVRKTGQLVVIEGTVSQDN